MIPVAPDWLAKAEADFHSMEWEMQAPTVNHDAVVFHGQQAIEKLLKGALAAAGIAFDKTHDLNILAHLISKSHPAWTWDPLDLAALQPGAVLLRYPGYSASLADAQRAIAACTRIRASVLV